MKLDFNTDTPAVVLGLFDTGLSVARLLARSGIKVIAVTSDYTDVGQGTVCAKVIRAPDPVTQSTDLLEKLIAISTRLGTKPVLYPASDTFVSFVSRNRKILANHYLFLLPSAEITNNFLNKKSQFETVEKAEILQPLSVFPGENLSAEQIVAKLSFPLFVKPLYLFPWEKYFSVKGYLTHNLRELGNVLASARNHHLDVMVQETIVGDDYRHFECSFFIDETGAIRGKTTIQKLRQYPLHFGLASYIRTVNHPVVEAEATKLVQRLGIIGFANIEFKIDKRDEKPKYIETNIRVWQQIGLGTKSGVRFVDLYYCHLTGQKIPEIHETHIGATWIDPITDFYSFTSQQGFKLSKLFRWFLQLRRANDHSVISWRDPIPTLNRLQYGLTIIKLFKFAIQKAFR